MQIDPTNAPGASLLHLSQNMFITCRSGPKISVRTRHPHWVMNLFAARAFRIPPPLLFLSTFYVSFTSLRLCSIFFLGEILVNEPDSEAPTIRQRTPPTRWCANIALRIKVFHLIIQGGISSSGYRPVLSPLFSVPKSRKHKIKKLILRL